MGSKTGWNAKYYRPYRPTVQDRSAIRDQATCTYDKGEVDGRNHWPFH
jgi:hypothetical protein